MNSFLKKTGIALFLLHMFFMPISLFAASASGACRSDVKWYCASSSAEINKKNGTSNARKEFAAGSESFVVPGLEFLNIPANSQLGDILVKVYTYFLGLVGISALVMVIWGGIQYALATESGAKEARQKITNALIGLAIALLGYLGLLTINPDLVKKLELDLKPITMGGVGASAPKGTCIAGAWCSDPLGAKDASGNLCLGNLVCDANGNADHCSVDRSSQCQVVNSGTCSITYRCKAIYDKKDKCDKECDTKCLSEEIGEKTKYVCASDYHTDTHEFGSPDVCSRECKDGHVKYGLNICRGETGPANATFSCTTNPGKRP